MSYNKNDREKSRLEKKNYTKNVWEISENKMFEKFQIKKTWEILLFSLLSEEISENKMFVSINLALNCWIGVTRRVYPYIRRYTNLMYEKDI